MHICQICVKQAIELLLDTTKWTSLKVLDLSCTFNSEKQCAVIFHITQACGGLHYGGSGEGEAGERGGMVG